MSRWALLFLASCLGAAEWAVGSMVLGPGSGFDSVAVKDPSIVRFGGRWHLFYTARNATDYSLGYVSAERLEGLAGARRVPLRTGKYAAAPQVFYFRPQKKWYLIYQTTDSNYQPVFATTSDLTDPESWTAAAPLVAKDERAKWIDFWVICDAERAYLFYTREHKDVVVRSTRLADFPGGWGEPVTVLAPVHEAVHVYADGAGFVMLFEQQEGDVRRFGLARAPAVLGPWRVVDGNFAAREQLRYPAGAARWTEEISHGELLRTGFDERLAIGSGPWRFLIQGLRREEHKGAYPLLPWRLGVITKAADHLRGKAQ